MTLINNSSKIQHGNVPASQNTSQIHPVLANTDINLESSSLPSRELLSNYFLPSTGSAPVTRALDVQATGAPQDTAIAGAAKVGSGGLNALLAVAPAVALYEVFSKGFDSQAGIEAQKAQHIAAGSLAQMQQGRLQSSQGRFSQGNQFAGAEGRWNQMNDLNIMKGGKLGVIGLKESNTYSAGTRSDAGEGAAMNGYFGASGSDLVNHFGENGPVAQKIDTVRQSAYQSGGEIDRVARAYQPVTIAGTMNAFMAGLNRIQNELGLGTSLTDIVMTIFDAIKSASGGKIDPLGTKPENNFQVPPTSTPSSNIETIANAGRK